MKTRVGFVSNSSSSSFVVKREDLTDEQLVKLVDALGGTRDGWTISNWNEEIHGSTLMDNGELSEALQRLGVETTKFKWYDQWGENGDDEPDEDEFDAAVGSIEEVDLPKKDGDEHEDS